MQQYDFNKNNLGNLGLICSSVGLNWNFLDLADENHF